MLAELTTVGLGVVRDIGLRLVPGEVTAVVAGVVGQWRLSQHSTRMW